jgi:hypothetical protein
MQPSFSRLRLHGQIPEERKKVSMHKLSATTRTTLISAFFLLTAGAGLTGSQAQAQPVAATTAVDPALTIPAGATMQVALIRPVWAGTASPGASIYAQTTFPVTVGGKIAVPPGTFVEGRLEKLTRPARRSNRGELQILFTHIIFANGYVAALPGANIGAPAPTAVGAQNNPAETLIAVAIQVSQRNDLLLDNGAQIEITLASPLTLDLQAVAAAIPQSRAPVPGQFKSASLCRPIPGSPGTPGTPDTVIPGPTGTPDTVIPGGPGMPDTVIPGTPGTPSTTIPGSPGTPGSSEIPCPIPPIVISSTPVHNQSP